MTKFVFADEAGCFTFKRQSGASKFFIVCTIATDECSMGSELLELRRSLMLQGENERAKMHATTDTQVVRDSVYKILGTHNFRVDATILEKSKAQPQTRLNDQTFYRYACYHHFKDLGMNVISSKEPTLVTAAALGSKRTRAAFKEAFNNSLQSIIPRDQWKIGFMESSQDPMLWAADYCAWAIQRKWERQDSRSYDLISNKIATESDLWGNGTTHYY